MSGKISSEETAFGGDAYISCGDSYALLSGNHLERNGKTLIEADSDLFIFITGNRSGR